MGNFFNVYSLPIVVLSVLSVLGLAYWLIRRKAGPGELLAAGALLFGVVFAWVQIRPIQTPLPESAQAVQALIGQGTPVLLEFQSPY